ncbi:filamentous hemagglutinin N-terminal domain-containing protein [Xenorhabdus cabanillasii]|uniref:two-partner secretion domain-containing protein n=2 Tax=Xenorhabdus cabanillasii TaxID=351673 RepID=UPI000C05D0E8|nr:filamentous hemagglutinin N-terminal domain-containing protein [Xenorhabdus cabanillasii]PHM75459.1 ShlA/HecA/FhaA exofamily protein [Xenorhabdus cabanillasii JM26]
MNRLCYRVIFSQTRQMLMVVSELASGHTAGKTRGETPAPSSRSSCRVSLAPLILGISLALGLVSPPVAARIVADHNAPGHEQPTVIPAANGVPQVNIQTPNSDGVSRNQYRQFDVAQKGAILNNSTVNTQTALAGYITGNPWLAKGEAKIILNEVNSRDPSQLNGFIEVAGQRADVVIANPAGITCRGCGFINAAQTTLAVGQTVLENGRLKGFEVKNGEIAVEGKGLNDTESDHTRLIARAVKLNAKLHAQDLTVTTGQNRVDARGNVVQTRTRNGEEKPAFSLDVAAIGGMYANKIKLAGTEQGVGVRNAGHLGAQAGDVILNSHGTLTNRGLITASAAVTIQNQGDVTNQGNVQARNVAIRNDGHLINRGVMAASKDITLNNQGNLTNQGEMKAHRDLTIKADQVDNQGDMLAGCDLDSQSTTLHSQSGSLLAAGVDRHGQLTQPGNLTLTARESAQLNGRNLARDTLSVQAKTLSLAGSQTAAKDLQLTSETQLNVREAKVHARKTLTLSAPTLIDNQHGELSAETLALHSQKLKNNRGKITQTGQQSLRLEHQEGIENEAGVIASNGQDLVMKAETIANDKGALLHAGTGSMSMATNQFQGKASRLLTGGALKLTGGDYHLVKSQTSARHITADIQSLDHRLGDMTQSGQGLLSLNVRRELDNGSGKITANGAVKISADTLNNNTLTENQLNNSEKAQHKTVLEKPTINHRSGKIMAAKGGPLEVAVVNSLNNQAGQLLAAHGIQVSAPAINNQQGEIAASSGDIVLNTPRLDNQTGRITGQQKLRLKTQGMNNEKGHVQASTVDIETAQQRLNNHDGVIAAEKNLSLRTGALLNRHGLIQSGQDLIIDTHGQLLDNQNSGQQAGILSRGDMHLNTGEIQNQSGHIGSHGRLTATGKNVINQQGQILGGKDTALTLADLNNEQGLLQSGGKLALKTQSLINRKSGDKQGITSKQSMVLKTGALDNTDGVMVSAGGMKVSATTVENRQGWLTAKHHLEMNSGALNNQAGRIQAGQRLSVDTQGQGLNNTAGVLDSGDQLTIRSGDTINDGGTLHGGSAVQLTTGQLDNQHGGQILSEHTLGIAAKNLLNTQGQLRALRHLSVNAGAGIDNTAGLIRSGGNIHLNAQHIHNANTRQSDKGIEGQNVEITGAMLHNRQGQLTAIKNADLTLKAALDNTQGQLQANQHLKAQGEKLALTNTGGEVRTGQTLSVTGESLTGDGQLHSLGDITLNLQNDFTHTGETVANGRLQLNSQGHIINHSLISAEILQGSVASLTNTTTGKLLARHHQWNVKKELHNTGLMDGAQTYLKAHSLTNQGTGRIYGDHVAIEADRLDNLVDVETQAKLQTPQRNYRGIVAKGVSAVMAARHRLDIGARVLNNHTHSLIYSEGDLSIGGQLNSQQRATGKGEAIHNHSAGIESAGDMRLAMKTINNVNDHLETQLQPISQTPERIYQQRGNRYNTKDYRIRVKNSEVNLLCINNWGCTTRDDTFQKIDFTRTVHESRVKDSDPAKILAGKNLTLDTDTPGGLKNQNSQVVAGGLLTVSGGNIHNAETPGERHINDQGRIDSYWRIKKKGRDRQGHSARPYYDSQIQAIKLQTSTIQAQQGHVTLNGQRPEHYQGTTASIAPVDNSQVGVFFERSDIKTVDMAQRQGQRLEVVSQQPVATGEKPLRVQTEVPNYRLPDNSLFKLNAHPAPDNEVLVETDPNFTQLKRWLGTDYMQNQLRRDHNTLHKRLGDGFYEQRLIREQIINLTGQRYLPGYQNDEDQFKALMNAGIRAQQAFNLAPGVALSAAQMARLTEDMVWLVNTTVKLPDGSRQTVRVPQVYVRTKGHQLDGNGALLSGSQVNLQLAGDLLNQGGRIAGRDITVLAETIRNQGGHLQSDQLSLQARTDLVQRGGSMVANDLHIQASRNIEQLSFTLNFKPCGVIHPTVYLFLPLH